MKHPSSSAIEDYLYANIPLTKALGVRVEHAAADKVILLAPFANNINHKKTVFGGSLHAVATLACWCLLYVNLKQPVQIVITKSDVDYKAPVDDEFRAVCLLPHREEWQRFTKTLEAKGKARITLHASIHQHKRLCVDYTGVFAALNPP